MPARYQLHHLGLGDEQVLAMLASGNGRFGAGGEQAALEPLDADDTARFLADDRTICLVAVESTTRRIAGFLYACVLYRRHTKLRHLCVYETGVDVDHRGLGVGRILVEGLTDAARSMGIDPGFVVTTTSDPETVEIYQSMGGVRGAPGSDVVFALRF